MPHQNPFPVAMLTIVDTRVQLEAIERELTRLTRLIQRVQLGAPEPIRRDDFVHQMTSELTNIERDCKALSTSVDTLQAEMRTLARRVDAGENLTRYDVTVPWERRMQAR